MAHVTAPPRRETRVFLDLDLYHQHHFMRILSPAPDVPTLAPPRHDAKKADSIINEGAETMSARNPSIAVTSAMPTVVLDTDVVSDNMAARLCASFLGHVLFLKNQVPL